MGREGVLTLTRLLSVSSCVCMSIFMSQAHRSRNTGTGGGRPIYITYAKKGFYKLFTV